MSFRVEASHVCPDCVTMFVFVTNDPDAVPSWNDPDEWECPICALPPEQRAFCRTTRRLQEVR